MQTHGRSLHLQLEVNQMGGENERIVPGKANGAWLRLSCPRMELPLVNLLLEQISTSPGSGTVSTQGMHTHPTSVAWDQHSPAWL